MARLLTSLFALLLPALLLPASGQTVSPFAGGGPNKIPATSATIEAYGVAVDAAGNFYIASSGRNRIFKVSSTTGIITTVAGYDAQAFLGDGGPAVHAALFIPAGVAFDSHGNVYIADSYNNSVRKVDTAGIITTLAGNGNVEGGFSGDGGPATSAQLNIPSGVAVDGAGNIYIADTLNYRVRKIDNSGIITTVAGNGMNGYNGDGIAATSAELNYVYSVEVDGSGNLYLADSLNQRIRKVGATGVITTVAGTGTFGYNGDGIPAKKAELRYPNAVRLRNGSMYIADGGNSRIRRVNPAGTISTVAGNGMAGYSGDGGQATSAELGSPNDIAFDSTGNYYIVDSGNDRIRKVSTAGIITTVAGDNRDGYGGDGGPANNAELTWPRYSAADRNGNVYIADAGYPDRRVRKVNSSGVISTLVANLDPEGLAVDEAGNLYIADLINQRVRKVDTAGDVTTVAGTGVKGFRGDGGPATSARLNNPCGVSVDGNGNLYIADANNKRIRKVDSSGVITTFAGTGLGGFSGDGGPATAAKIGPPSDVAADKAGNVYISDYVNHRIRKVNTAGVITTVAGNGQVGYSGDGGPAINAKLGPQTNNAVSVAVDNHGNFYISDVGNGRLRKVNAAGIITTVAGNGITGFKGNGGPATAAEFYMIGGVTFDSSGTLYISDTGNYRVRKIAGGVE